MPGDCNDTCENQVEGRCSVDAEGVVGSGGLVNCLRLVNHENFAPDVKQLIRTAISMEIDGLVIPNRTPEAQDPVIKDAAAAGIMAEVIKDDTIDSVITISAGDADSAAIEIEQVGKDGTQMFSINPQPCLQSFLAVGLRAVAINFGADPPTFPVVTDPGIIDAANIKATLAGISKSVR